MIDLETTESRPVAYLPAIFSYWICTRELSRGWFLHFFAHSLRLHVDDAGIQKLRPAKTSA